MSSARIDFDGNMHALDRKVEPAEVFSEEDAKDAGKLARAVQRLLRSTTDLARIYEPQRVDFEDRDVTSGTPLRLEHAFGGRVRWWIVDWQPTTPGDVAIFERSTDADDATLILDVGNSGTVTVRVEEAG